MGESGDDELVPDKITTTPRLIVCQSATRNRVVIYAATAQGAARIYRPPDGAKVAHVSALNRYVLITAIAPGTTQLAVYDIDQDKWAVQDFRWESKGREIRQAKGDFPLTPGGELRPILAPVFYGLPTQLAVLDFEHFRWSAQDLVEPFDEKSAYPYSNANLAVYVLGRYIYAYSNLARRWDVLTLSRPLIRGARTPQASGLDVDDHSVAVSQDGQLHIFPARTGRWQTITDTKD